MSYTGKLAKVAVFAIQLSCSPRDRLHPEAIGENPPLVGPEELSEMLHEPGLAVLHADFGRSAFDEAHIPGARWLDMDSIVWEGDPPWRTELRPLHSVKAALESAGVNDGDHIVMYSHNPLYASRLFLTLEATGFDGHLSVLDGGFSGWRERDLPVTADAPDHLPGSVTLAPPTDILVSADWIAARLDRPGIALVDARPDDEYTGADDGMGGISNPGHIPGAHQLYWEQMVESRELPWLHAPDSLNALFRGAGAQPSDTLVVYCMVGWRASFTYLAAKATGREVKFYDGSWRDWGTREDLPYVRGEEPRG